MTEDESAIADAIGDAEAVIVATGKASLNPADAWAVDNKGEGFSTAGLNDTEDGGGKLVGGVVHCRSDLARVSQ